MRSIRSRTLLLVLGLLSLTLTLISYKSYRDARHEVEEVFDAGLVQTARLLAGMVGGELPASMRQAMQAALDEAMAQNGVAGQGDVPAGAVGHEYESKLGFVIYDEHGQALLQSASAPAAALDALDALVQRRPPAAADAATADRAAAPLPEALAGYHEVRVDGHRWRLFMLHDVRDRQWVLVGEREDVRGELAAKIALRSLLPDLIGLPLLAVLVWLAVGWGLRPLARMVRLLKARDPGNLSPLVLAPLPQELEPVVASLNRLLGQLTALLEREKRFLADAAHELRTPLAVLRIHAQNALQAPDPGDREEALKQLVGGVERATRVVTQLLTLARLEPGAAKAGMAPLELATFVRGALAGIIPLALERGQELSFECAEGGDFSVPADAPSLEILLQNLVANALQHSPEGGLVRVELRPSDGVVELSVHDSGPGVPPALRAQVFERFFRHGPGQGAGLGLSIVTRIAELHGGSIELGDSPLGGLEFTVRLPRSAR
ncbi:ATP-binding protein [Thauera chlorobenzoica]|uniref:histidine kinase n=1 Tax=Thauera chlorobenzoica TaxID=96773 RepID=A0A1H5STW8_9RHOO|nr:ATP-binding protein [Thauera chlorobenzoica]APR03985.1 Sensory histidine kinase QseC [Thauera chlorobenzoica]SEF53301.1 two-component system, OmpR family, sensor histidine kinase QseC [Thauera chlorobenzoica]